MSYKRNFTQIQHTDENDKATTVRVKFHTDPESQPNKTIIE